MVVEKKRVAHEELVGGSPTSLHQHGESDITSLVTDLAAKEATTNKGVVNGYAGLDAGGKVPASQLPFSGAGDFAPLRFRLPGRYHSCFPDSNGTLALTINRLYAVPFYVVQVLTLTRIAIHVTTLGSGASARLGIYTDNGVLYPGSLKSDCGVVSMTSTGIKEITGLNIALSANTLYWLVLVCNVAATIAAFAIVYLNALLGYPTTALNTVGFSSYYVAFTYAALPGTYPGSATLNNAAFPKIAVYFS